MKSEKMNERSSSSFKAPNVTANCSRKPADNSYHSVEELKTDFYRIQGDQEVKILPLENRLRVHHQKLVEGLASQFRKQAFCDVVLKVGSSM